MGRFNHRCRMATYKEDGPSYAEDPGAVVDRFFVRTVYYDSESYLFPVGIEMYVARVYL